MAIFVDHPWNCDTALPTAPTSVRDDPSDQMRENANNLSSASRVFSPNASRSILGAKVSYKPEKLKVKEGGKS